MTDTTPEPATSDAAAADGAAADDLTCPVCEYSLRGLPEPRCPECGYAFEWEELRQRSRLRRTWFYEHAGTFKSHVKTRWRSLRPKAFWSEIGAYTFADPKRLRRYRLTTLLLTLLACLPFALPLLGGYLDSVLPRGKTVIATTLPSSGPYTLLNGGRPIFQSGRIWRGPVPRGMTGRAASTFGPAPQTPYFQYYVPAPFWAELLRGLTPGHRSRASGPMVAVAVGFYLAMPLLMAVYWRLLRVSALKAAIKPVHLTRVNAYTTDVLPVLILLVAGSVVFPDFFELGLFFLPVVMVLMVTWRLSSALRRYVRFPHALPVALAFGVIVGLTWLVLAINAALASA